MGGGLMELVAYGCQDMYIAGPYVNFQLVKETKEKKQKLNKILVRIIKNTL